MAEPNEAKKCVCVGSGESITIRNTYHRVQAGSLIRIGFDGLFGVAANDADIGDEITVHLEGVYAIPNPEMLDFDIGEVVYWDFDKECLVEVGHLLPSYKIGHCVGLRDGRVLVRLCQVI